MKLAGMLRLKQYSDFSIRRQSGMMHTRNHRPRIRSEKPFHTEKNHLDAMTKESIEQFLVFQQEERYSPESLKIHRGILHYLYDFLPEGKKF